MGGTHLDRYRRLLLNTYLPAPVPILWLKADAQSFNDGDAVGTWTDSSSSANNATQSTSAQKPTFRTNAINGRPAIYFDGNDALQLGTGITIGTGEFTAFVVYRRVGVSVQHFFGGTSSALGFRLNGGTDGTDAQLQVSDSSSSLHTGTNRHRPGTWALASFTKTAGGTATYTQRLKSAANGSGTSATTFSNATSIIGAVSSGGSSGFNGYLAEVIMYNRVLSDDEIAATEAYLNAKYAVLTQARALWLQADAITGKSDGDSLTQWLDSSGQGIRVLSSGSIAPLYKTNLQNSLPGVRFGDTANTKMSTESMFWNGDVYTIYVVYNYKSASSTSRRALQGSTNWLIGPYSNIHRCFSGGFSTGLNVVQDQFVIQWVVGIGATSNTNYVNGTAYTSGGSASPGTIGLSAHGAFAEQLNGDILEVIIESRADDSTQMAATKNYLAAKYNITVV
jgi:concanavalin A-like lectin/glucanase superfamily protein